MTRIRKSYTSEQPCKSVAIQIGSLKQDQQNKELRAKKTNKKSTSDESDGGLVVIPYVGGLSEASERIFRKYGISTAIKPYKTLRNLLVHSKDKCTVGQAGKCVYKIPCNNYSSMYIGETGRSYGKRQEHRKNGIHQQQIDTGRLERFGSRNQQVSHKLTDHVAKENHVTDWSSATILDKESQRRTRQLKESICIRMEANSMNRDAGAYNLPTTYDGILVTRSSSTSHDHMPDEVRHWRTKRRN